MHGYKPKTLIYLQIVPHVFHIVSTNNTSINVQTMDIQTRKIHVTRNEEFDQKPNSEQWWKQERKASWQDAPKSLKRSLPLGLKIPHSKNSS